MKKRITAILIAALMLLTSTIPISAATTAEVITPTAGSVGYSAARVVEFEGEATTITETTDLSNPSGNYIISSQVGMDAFAEAVNVGVAFESCTVYLQASGLEVTTPIGNLTGEKYSFKGTFDGQGNIVSFNFKADETTGVGFFGYVSGNAAEIKNLVVDGRISGVAKTNGVAGIVGACTEAPTIDNCINMLTISGESQNCGGILGVVASAGTSPKISNCTNLGNITGCTGVGGILGSANGLSAASEDGESGLAVSNCVNYGNVSIVSCSSTTVSKATYNSTYAGCGGIVGRVHKGGSSDDYHVARISGCVNYGTVSSALATKDTTFKISGCAGIVGTASVFTNISISDCFNYGMHTENAFIDQNSKDSNVIGVAGAWGTIPGLLGSYKEAYDTNTPMISVSYNGIVKFTSNVDKSTNTTETETLVSLKQMYIGAYGQTVYNWDANDKIPVQFGTGIILREGYGAQTKYSADDGLDVRFVNAVDVTDKPDVKAFGYYVIITYGSNSVQMKGDTTTVYTSVKADRFDESAATLGGENADYIYLANIKGYKGKDNVTYHVVPFVELTDGNKIYSQLKTYEFKYDGTQVTE